MPFIFLYGMFWWQQALFLGQKSKEIARQLGAKLKLEDIAVKAIHSKFQG